MDNVEKIDNKSYWYILPMLGNSYKQFKSSLRGCFIRAEEFPELTSHIFLLFEKSDSLSYSYFKDELKEFVNFYKEYQPDNFYEMLVFDVPISLLPDYDSFMDGKYSKVSEEYKRHLLKFHKEDLTENALNNIVGILWRGKKYRASLEDKLGVELTPDQELASIIDMKKETYTEDMKVITPTNNLDLLR